MFCFSLEAGRDYMRDGDFSGGTFVGLTLSFKTLAILQQSLECRPVRVGGDWAVWLCGSLGADC